MTLCVFLFDVRQVGVVSEDDNYVDSYYVVKILSTTYTMQYEKSFVVGF